MKTMFYEYANLGVPIYDNPVRAETEHTEIPVNALVDNGSSEF